jgi:hypothetical protein
MQRFVWVLMRSGDITWPEEVMFVSQVGNKILVMDRTGETLTLKEYYRNLSDLRKMHPRTLDPVRFNMSGRQAEIGLR